MGGACTSFFFVNKNFDTHHYIGIITFHWTNDSILWSKALNYDIESRSVTEDTDAPKEDVDQLKEQLDIVKNEKAQLQQTLSALQSTYAEENTAWYV